MEDRLLVPKHRRKEFYVLYKGDEIITSGTVEEIHEKTDKSISSLLWLTTPAASRREAEAQGGRMIMVRGD